MVGSRQVGKRGVDNFFLYASRGNNHTVKGHGEGAGAGGGLWL